MRVLILLNCLFLSSGCDQNSAGEREILVQAGAEINSRANPGSGFQESSTPLQDYHLATEIRLVMMEDPLIREVFSEIELGVSEGTVRLSGYVENIEIRDKVERLAWRVDGVTGVVIQLNVLSPGESTGVAAENSPVLLPPGEAEELDEREEHGPSTESVDSESTSGHENALPLREQGEEAIEAELDVGDEYTVQEGESLWSIARDHLGDGNEWTRLLYLNREQLDDDPDHVYPGMVLIVPVVE